MRYLAVLLSTAFVSKVSVSFEFSRAMGTIRWPVWLFYGHTGKRLSQHERLSLKTKANIQKRSN